MTAKPFKKGATYDDLRDVPDHFVAEMFDGDLYASPRPGLPHVHATSVLTGQLIGGFHRSGPGGWVILCEPELHFGNDVLVPDLAGWRRERLPSVPPDAYVTLAPDWVCEVLSAATESIDRGRKLRVYARERVGHVWLVDPLRRTIEVLALDSGGWAAAARHEGSANVCAAPFAGQALDLGALWI